MNIRYLNSNMESSSVKRITLKPIGTMNLSIHIRKFTSKRFSLSKYEKKMLLLYEQFTEIVLPRLLRVKANVVKLAKKKIRKRKASYRVKYV